MKKGILEQALANRWASVRSERGNHRSLGLGNDDAWQFGLGSIDSSGVARKRFPGLLQQRVTKSFFRSFIGSSRDVFIVDAGAKVALPQL